MLTHLQVATAVALIVGYFAAHAAGLLTKAHAPAWVFGLVTTILATLAGVLPTVVWNPTDGWQTYLANVFAALVATTLAHRSQIPTALKLRTGGVVGAPARPTGQAGYGLVELAFALVLIVLAIILIVHFVG